MMRLLEIEWLKLKHYRPFWVLIGMYVFCITLVGCSGMLFLNYLKNQGVDFEGIDPTIIPIYDYPDVWQNLTWVAALFKVIPAFIVIISVANEATYRTLRQNVIDGLSHWDFLVSKMIFIVALALGSTVLVGLIALIMATAYSHVQGWDYMFQSSGFLPAYFLVVLTYLVLALMLALLIPRAGILIVALFLYTMIFEPIASVILMHHPDVPGWIKSTVPFFPVRSLYNLIPIPFPRYLFMEIHDYVSTKSLAIVLLWLVTYTGLSALILDKKDW